MVIEQLYGVIVEPLQHRNPLRKPEKRYTRTMVWTERPIWEQLFWLSPESGYMYKNKECWQIFTEIYDFKWIPRVRHHMERYCNNIDDSFIEERQSCIRFNYKNAETEHGMIFIHDLNYIIRKAIQGTNTEFINGSGFIEVKPI